jgi:hypothetical protein
MVIMTPQIGLLSVSKKREELMKREEFMKRREKS